MAALILLSIIYSLPQNLHSLFYEHFQLTKYLPTLSYLLLLTPSTSKNNTYFLFSHQVNFVLTSNFILTATNTFVE